MGQRLLTSEHCQKNFERGAGTSQSQASRFACLPFAFGAKACPLKTLSVSSGANLKVLSTAAESTPNRVHNQKKLSVAESACLPE